MSAEPNNEQVDESSQPPVWPPSQRQMQIIGGVVATLGVLSAVAGLLTSPPGKVVAAVIIVAAVGVGAFLALLLARRGNEQPRLSWWKFLLVVVVAIALGAAGMAFAQSRGTQEPPPPGQSSPPPGPPSIAPKTTGPPSTTSSLPSSAAPPTNSVDPPPPHSSDDTLPVCSGGFRALVRTVKTSAAFDVVATYECLPRANAHPWVAVRLQNVGTYKTTNFYPLVDFSEQASPFLFHSKPVEPNPLRCYLIVVFSDGVAPKKEYINSLPGSAYEASDCVPSP
jgi:hypothetical protein